MQILGYISYKGKNGRHICMMGQLLRSAGIFLISTQGHCALQ